MPSNNRVWVIDDDKSIRWVLEKALSQANFVVETFESGRWVLEQLEHIQPQAIITDVRMPGTDGFQLLDRIHQKYSNIPVIIMTAHSDLDSAVTAFQGGAFEYLPKPFDVDEAVEMVVRAVRHQHEELESVATDELSENEISREIVGEAPAMQEVFRAIGRLSRSNLSVLITGESGTGKELVARALHRHSPRAEYPFIALNTAAIPKELLESELFGHEKGAFTGAQTTRIGRFQQADGGTLFLDEIGDMPDDLHAFVLRVLAEGEFYRVGGHSTIKVNVRIIAATHQNLEELVRQRLFREDLFHRLNVIRVHVPALKERREDIPLLLRHFMHKAAQELETEAKTILPETERFMGQLAWPGNVRQLENICRWLTVMASGQQIHIEDLPPELRHSETIAQPAEDWESALRYWADSALDKGEQHILDQAVPRFEQVMIETALKHTAGRKQDAAKLLGWGRNTLTRKIKELDLKNL